MSFKCSTAASPIFFLFLFLAVTFVYYFGAIPYLRPFVWSSKSSTTIEKALYPSEITNASCNVPNPSSYRLKPPEEPHLHEQLKNYLVFHAKARACLLDPSCKQTPRILIAKCSRDRGCAGLGDRLRGLLFSFTIALITKRVFFLGPLNEPFPLQSGLTPFAVDWTLPSTVVYNKSWPHLEWNWCSKGRICEGNAPALTDFENFDDVGPGINMLTADIEKLFHDKPVVSMTSRNRFRRLRFIQENPYLKDRYGDLAKYLLERKVNFYRLMFQPSPPVRQVMKPMEFSGDYISVHIRTGVDAKEDKSERFSYWSSHEEETVERTFRCIEEMGKDMKNIFLASDSPKTKEIFTRKAKEMGYEVHLFEKRTVHSSRFKRKIAKKGWDDVCEGFLTVFGDLFMLSRGKVLIKNGSHFSTLAWFLSRGQQALQLEDSGECKSIGKPY